MKVVILAGGFGTRISEESHLLPKPMIEIGEKPILWHIMKYYSSYGFNDFVICLGYKAYKIKEFFSDYYLHMSDVTFDLKNNNMTVHNSKAEPWKVTLIDTGLHTMTGGRLKRVKEYLGSEPFMMTYGDGLSDVNIDELLSFHKQHKKIITLTAIQPEGRFGVLHMEDNMVKEFKEKNRNDSGWINGGFMVIEPEIFDYIQGDHTVLEKEPLITIANSNQLIAYKHYGFWQCMDTQRDKQYLEDMWNKGDIKWMK